MELSEADRSHSEHLEEELWREETRFDLIRMNEVIAPDFFEIGRSGRIYQRADTLGAVPEPNDARFPLQEFRARLLAPDVAQVTYNSAVKYSGEYLHGRRSSIWSRGANGWVLRFHQGAPFEADA